MSRRRPRLQEALDHLFQVKIRIGAPMSHRFDPPLSRCSRHVAFHFRHAARTGFRMSVSAGKRYPLSMEERS